MINAILNGKSIRFPYDKKEIAVQGDGYSERVSFEAPRFYDSYDLSECQCAVHTENSTGATDIIIPNVEVNDKILHIIWVLSPYSTSVPGPIKIQLCFRQGEEYIWMSRVEECVILPGLNAENIVVEQQPSLFSRWESDMRELRDQAGQFAGLVGGAVDILTSHAAQIEQLPESLAQVQSHKNQALAYAQSAAFHADRAQAIAGITPESFAGALIGTGYGGALSVREPQAGTPPRSFSLIAKTIQSGSGEKAPDNPYAITGAGESGEIEVSISDGAEGYSLEIPLSDPLYSLPDGLIDTVDLLTGTMTRHTKKAVIDGTHHVSWFYRHPQSTEVTFNIGPGGKIYGLCLSSSFPFGLDTGEPCVSLDKSGLAYFQAIPDILTGVNASDTEEQARQKTLAWFAANPQILVYERAEALVQSIQLPPVTLYSPISAITVSNPENCDLEINYTRDLRLVIEKLENAL